MTTRLEPPFDLFDLSGRVALVTGGSRGLGREMVRAFARAGADVVIASRKLDACQTLADEVERETGRRALPFACHVGHWDQVESLVDAAYEAFGKVDILVNNAGMSPLYDTPATITEALWDKVQEVNLKGPFRLTALVGERMLAGDGGSILNISTTGAANPYPGMIPYHSAKAGMNAFTIAFAKAWAPKVRVNCIMPGGFLTDIAESWSEEQRSGKNSLFGRQGRPEEIVGAALYFVSDASSYATGAILTVGGGPP
jgi:NAD(P)-dependent dehydrogenase (short-subunit alcohol dehydrogenase family)